MVKLLNVLHNLQKSHENSIKSWIIIQYLLWQWSLYSRINSWAKSKFMSYFTYFPNQTTKFIYNRIFYHLVIALKGRYFMVLNRKKSFYYLKGKKNGIHALKADEDEKKALKYLLLSSFHFPIFWISYGFFFLFFEIFCWISSALVLRTFWSSLIQ